MKFGVAFTTLSIDVPAYLSYLYTSFKSGGGRTQRASIQHIDQVIEGAFSEPPDAIVVCAGLGARTLGGVEDTSLYPVRGQTILIRAPWCKTGRTVRVAGGGVYNVPRPSGFVCWQVCRPLNGLAYVLNALGPLGWYKGR
jgi:D-aspartate oxidase